MNPFKHSPQQPTPWWTKAINLGTVCAVAAMQIGLPTVLNASDHIDSPTLAQDRGADIADLYAFLDPNDNSKVVLILSTQGFVISGEHFGMVIFDHNIRHRFEIENTGDAVPDMFVDVTYSKGIGRLTTQTATISVTTGADRAQPVSFRRPPGPSAPMVTFTAPTTVANQDPTPPPIVVTTNTASGISFYAGAADDPFFLDDTGANRFVASSIMNPGNPNKSLFGLRGGRDTYAGFSTMITAISIPVAMLRGAPSNQVIGINSVMQRRQNQQIDSETEYRGSGAWVNVDRCGNPLVNNGLITGTRKNEYNGASTADDERGRFRADITQNLRNLGTNDTFIAMILGVIQTNGDILRLDLAVPNSGPQGGNNASGGFGKMGGRRLTDDVVDGVFTLINNGTLLTDFVSANEVPFRNAFPFVADVIQPFPPGPNPDDRTRL